MYDTLRDVSEIRHLYAVPDDFHAFTMASRTVLPARRFSRTPPNQQPAAARRHLRSNRSQNVDATFGRG
jgi:hypothetical protein